MHALKLFNGGLVKYTPFFVSVTDRRLLSMEALINDSLVLANVTDRRLRFTVRRVKHLSQSRSQLILIRLLSVGL